MAVCRLFSFFEKAGKVYASFRRREAVASSSSSRSLAVSPYYGACRQGVFFYVVVRGIYAFKVYDHGVLCIVSQREHICCDIFEKKDGNRFHFLEILQMLKYNPLL
jgi:hypothetical protein